MNTAQLATDAAATDVDIGVKGDVEVDVDIDFDIDAAVSLPTAAAKPAERAQAIDCGGIGVAIPFSWARSVVEQYELSEVPNAPAWLAGAANVEGRIVAVVDLAAWALPGESLPAAPHSRLLLGGEGDAMFALRFSGLPSMVRCAPWSDTALEIPAALRPFIAAEASHESSARLWPVVDMAALAQAWAADMVG